MHSRSLKKPIKALLEYHTFKIPKKHDLIQLKIAVSDLIAIDNDDILDSLNRLYTEARYPGDLGLMPEGKPDIEDAKMFYECAKSIFQRITNMIA